MVADIISVPTNPFGTHEEGWGGQKRCVSNCVPCVPLCFCFALAPICSSKGVLLNAHVQHSVACLGVSEIRAYLSQLCAFCLDSKSCHVLSLFHDLSSCCKCHGHVHDMHVAWCMHDASSHDIPWTHPNIHYSPLDIQPNSTDNSHSPQTHLPWVKNEPLLKWIS